MITASTMKELRVVLKAIPGGNYIFKVNNKKSVRRR